MPIPLGLVTSLLFNVLAVAVGSASDPLVSLLFIFACRFSFHLHFLVSGQHILKT